MQLRRLMAAVTSVLVICSTAFACLWDSDTLRVEADGKPGIVDIIVGRFERNPPLYYEMRLERVSKMIENNPDDLGAYDDAAVSCERLGRSDDAIAWIEKKHDRLIAMTPGSQSYTDHLYRYHANLGTFLVHKWLRDGAKRDGLADLQASRDHIAKAIEINPNAHFGRERYQLIAIDWLLKPAPEGEIATSGWSTIFDEAFRVYGRSGHYFVKVGLLESQGMNDAVEGVSGLIQLGSAWESVDVFAALAIALASSDDASLSRLAMNRARELLDSGKVSLRPDLGNVPEAHTIAVGEYMPNGEDAIDTYFTAARAAADRWHEARIAYMIERMQKGEHPDTHPEFWKAFIVPASAKAPAMPLILTSSDRSMVWVAIFSAGCLTLAGLVWFVRRQVRRKRRSRIETSLPAATE